MTSPNLLRSLTGAGARYSGFSSNRGGVLTAQTRLSSSTSRKSGQTAPVNETRATVWSIEGVDRRVSSISDAIWTMERTNRDLSTSLAFD